MKGPASLLLVCLSLTACADDPGSSRIAVFAAADGTALWSRKLSTEFFDAPSSQPPGALNVLGYDNCPGAHFDRNYALEDGKLLSSRATGPSDSVSAPTAYDPPSPCPASIRRRYTLGQDRIIDVCAGDRLTLHDVKTGQLLLELAQGGLLGSYDVGVLVAKENDFTLFALDGKPRWTWPTPSTYTSPIGADAERIFMFDPEAGELLALEASDGGTAWQVQPGCEWASYASGVLVCGRKLRASSCPESD